MNLDLITKLAKLANNNPNDNEANLAARRACKLIEEGKFQFGIDSSKTTTKPSQATYQHVPNPFNDWFKQYYEPSQKQRKYYQQTEPKQSQQNTGQYRCKNCGAHLSYLSIVIGSYLCNNCDPKQKEPWASNYRYGSWDSSETKPKPKPQENVTVKCLFCKQDFKRKEFRSDFICHQCYVKKNKSEKPPIRDDRTTTYYKSVFCFACGHGFTVTYTELTAELIGQVSGKCEKCNEPYIRATK